MKIRKGFVSNSSSSSFIIELDKPIDTYSFEEFIEDYNIKDRICGEVLYKDLKATHKNVMDILSLEDEDTSNMVECYLNMDSSILDWDECEDIVKQARQFILEKIKEKVIDKFEVGDNFTRYIIDYDDDSDLGCTMEHEFMPAFKGTLKRISHH